MVASCQYSDQDSDIDIVIVSENFRRDYIQEAVQLKSPIPEIEKDAAIEALDRVATLA